MIAARQIITKHLAIIILIFIIGAYLVAKALPENSWDGWRVGSAQALLSDRHWANDGFLKNYLLFLPQGYSKVVRYFDDPQLRQHAKGITTGGLIGKRLYYTHYPSGYLLPSALLMKLGTESRSWFRFLEILLSLGGLILLYWILNSVSNRLIAFFGALYYSISILFLDYADALANQPIDELLRFAIIALSLWLVKSGNKKLNYLIWILYFILSISSYDSTFFVFVWLVGIDLMILKKIEWKKWLFWTSAPILAFGLQIFQNHLYLGWRDMILDFYGAFKVGIVGSRAGFFVSHLKRFIEPLGWFFDVKWYLGIFISALGIWLIKISKKYSEDKILNIRYLYLALAAILFHFLFFPSLFFYQGRLAAIFAALLVGGLTYSLIQTVKRGWRNLTISFLIIAAFVASLWFIQAKRTYAYIKQWPNNVWPAESINFDKKIKNLVFGDKVIFQILGPDREIFGSDRYPMAASEDEYYIDAPILGFTNTDDLIRDFNYLKNRSEFPFNTIIIADQKPIIEEIKTKLKIKELVLKIDNKFILIIK